MAVVLLPTEQGHGPTRRENPVAKMGRDTDRNHFATHRSLTTLIVVSETPHRAVAIDSRVAAIVVNRSSLHLSSRSG